MTTSRILSVALAVACLAGAAAAADGVPFVSRQLTPRGEYTSGIEGPATDRGGTLFVCNFERQGSIGRVSPGQWRTSQFASLPAGSIGNGIRFARDGTMYVADYHGHNVLSFEPGTTSPRAFFHSEQFHQPNDLAVAPDGTLYASDPDFRRGTGRIWRIVPKAGGPASGSVMASGRDMGTTNGLDLSPDGATLYVSESATRQIWAYRLSGPDLTEPRLVTTFKDGELDGLRTDVDGRIYVARPGAGRIAIVAPNGGLVREVQLLGADPTNLTFGGSEGETIFVTQRDGRFIETFDVDRPGREFCSPPAATSCVKVLP